MKIIDTRHLFLDIANRVQKAYPLVQSIFPATPAEAVQYELLQQGLLQNGALPLQLDAWSVVENQLQQLSAQWNGPTTQAAILPIQHGFIKNGVAYKHGICLFISPRLTLKELHALVAHEYHHICRQHHLNAPPTLLDSILMEGLAEHAVESLFGEHAISSWAKRYSLDEVNYYWHTYFIKALSLIGLHNHQAFLFGDAAQQLPAHIGYCVGYRIVEAFLLKNGPISPKQLLTIPSEEIALLAGFPLSPTV